MDSITVNILQWNSRSILPKKLDFEQMLFLEKIHIVALSETWLTSDCSFHIKNYNVFRQDRSDSYGGVAILTHRSIKAQICPTRISNSGIEIVHVKIFNCNIFQDLISVYCPPNIRTVQSDWDSLLSVAHSKTLILGDFNAHHSNWSNITNQRGNQVFDSMIDNNFIILNNGKSTRFKLVNSILQESTPDISMVSSDVGLQFNWNVSNDSLGSDHMMIKIATSNNFSPQLIKKRYFKKANWLGYRQFIEEALKDFKVYSDPEEVYDFFFRRFKQSCRFKYTIFQI